jgi:GTP:adenosylcobinamide-phosphate guanylyltransferase
MDALVTAGGVPTPEDPLYVYSQGKPKALIELAGKPMIQWVLDALSGSTLVDNVLIIGLDKDSGVKCKKPLYFFPNQGDMIDNIHAGTDRLVEINQDIKKVLTVSSDIPTITSEMVDWTVKTAMENDYALYYNVVERSVMEKRFPGSNRSYVKLKDRELCGGDMNVFALWVITAKEDLWVKLAAARKHAMKQAALIGYDTLLLILLRAINLENLAVKVSKQLDIPAMAVLCPYAEIAMDVDKPHQLELVKQDLEKQYTK